VTTGTTIAVFSSLGVGESFLLFLRDHGALAPFFAIWAALVLLLLYVLDYFCPPHLPGRHLVLHEGDSCAGSLLVVGVVPSLVVAGCLCADFHPSIPIIIAAFLPACTVIGIRLAVAPRHRSVEIAVPASTLEEADLRQRLTMLLEISADAQDQASFSLAAAIAFALAGSACMLIFVVRLVVHADDFHIARVWAREDTDLIFMAILAPLIFAVVNWLVSFLSYLGVGLSKSYCQQELAAAKRTSLHLELTYHRTISLQTKCDTHQLAEAEYLHQHAAFVRQLQNRVKVVGFLCFGALGAFYIAGPLFDLPHTVFSMTEYCLIAFTAFAVIFVFALFRDIWDTMQGWLMDLPLWERAAGVLQLNWSRAFILFIVLPYAPLLLLLSAVNQCVRRHRGFTERPVKPQASLANRVAGGSDSSLASLDAEGGREARAATPVDDSTGGDRSGFFTWRVEEQFHHMLDWDHLATIQWIYVFGFAMIIYSLSSLLLKIFLAYLSIWFDSWHLEFPEIVTCTFIFGLVLFMLPPVPGMLVYIFSGALFPKVCSWGPHGFWAGAVVSIVMGFVLKLMACTMQQKLIGERLGFSLWVRQQVGIHTPAIRTIEALLRKPGFSLGKVAILVGGPDWPTSVLCGILGLPLLQILIGTVPIIAFITPFSLTGTLMTKASEDNVDSGMWKRWASVMTVVSFLVGSVLWLVVAWATQEEYERNHVELTRPKVDYIDLDWLDYRSKAISQECHVFWGNVPLLVKLILVVGMVSILGASHLFFLAPGICYNSVNSSADPRELDWFGRGADCVFELPGAVGLILTAVSSICLSLFQWWRRSHVRVPLAVMCQGLDSSEAEWKRRRLEFVHAWGLEEDHAADAKAEAEAEAEVSKDGQTGETSCGSSDQPSPETELPPNASLPVSLPSCGLLIRL
jgi:hypothetical protein